MLMIMKSPADILRGVIAIGLMLLAGATGALGVVPPLMSYQGQLTTSAGVPVADGSYSVVFTIYDSPTGGISKWTESQTVTTSEGLFAVVLGSTTAITDTVFAWGINYLGIKVGTDPEMTPRVALVSMPYAFRVSTVDGAAGGTIIGDLNLSRHLLMGGTPFLYGHGIGNTFVGQNSGNLTMTGSYNGGSGWGALFSNTTGSFNTASGFKALYGNTSGYDNAAYGMYALWNNTSGWGNTATGSNALYSCVEGSSNTAIGNSALRGNISGTQNTACGADALYFNTIGCRNTASGVYALIQNTDGSSNTAAGWAALQQNSTGNNNCAYGYEALRTNTEGTNNSAFGYGADVAAPNLFNATALGNGALVNASNKIRLGNSSVTVIEGQVAYTYTSDRNKKENFEVVDGDEVLAKIRRLSLTSWNYRNQDPQKFRHYGPVAQDFFEAFGHDGIGQCGDSITINSGDMAGITLVAVQALEKQNEALKSEIAELRALVQRLAAERGVK